MHGWERGGVTRPPKAGDVKRYFGGLFGEKGSHNEDAYLLKEEEDKIQDLPREELVDVTVAELRYAVKNVDNCKSPGLGQVQNFWVESLKSIHPTLTRCCNEAIQDPTTVPDWLTIGLMTLVYKNGDSDNAKNYQPANDVRTYVHMDTQAPQQ